MVADSKKERIVPGKTWRSRLSLIPIFKRRQESRIEKRLVKIVRQSELCKSSPILRKLLIENIKICCIVVETSGAQSVKVVCAFVPYILTIISKSNPNFKRILEDPKVVSYLKALQNVDFESLLKNAYLVTFTIQKGISKCYYSYYFTVVRDSKFFCQDNLLSLVESLKHFWTFVFQFFQQHVYPILQSMVSHNRDLAKYILDCSLQLISNLLVSCVTAVRILKRSTTTACLSLKEIIIACRHVLKRCSTDPELLDCFRNCHQALKHLLAYLLSAMTSQYSKKILYYVSKCCEWCAKNIFPKVFKTVKNYFLDATPVLYRITRSFVFDSIPLLRSFFAENRELLLSLFKYAKRFFQDNAHLIKPFCITIFKQLMCVGALMKDFAILSVPHLIEFSSNVLIFLIYFCAFLSEHVIKLVKTIPRQLNLLCKACSAAFRCSRSCVYRQLHKLTELTRRIVNYVLMFILPLLEKSLRMLLMTISGLSPIVCKTVREVSSCVYSVSKEFAVRSFLGAKRVSPSLWCATRKTARPALNAAFEVVRSSKVSVTIIYPVLVNAVLVVSPDVSKGFVVVLTDGRKAVVQVAYASYVLTYELKEATKAVSSQFYLISKAFREVTKTTSYAVVEISHTSFKASSRMLKDCKNGLIIVNSSLSDAEHELKTSCNRAIKELNSLVKDNYPSLVLVSETSAILFMHTIHSLSYVPLKYSRSALVLANCTLSPIFYSCSDIYCYLVILALKSCKDLLWKSYDDLESNFLIPVIGYTHKQLLKITNISENAIGSIYVNYLGLLISVSNSYNSAIATASFSFLAYTCKIVCRINAKIFKDLVPNLWYRLKREVSGLWDKFCDFTPMFWTRLEHFAADLWDVVCSHGPKVWTIYKNVCRRLFDLICSFAPFVWGWTSSTIPILWSHGRDIVEITWKLHLRFSRISWDHASLFASYFWLHSCEYAPELWILFCENSKLNWTTFCFTAEWCWTATTETSWHTWGLLHKSVAKSWRNSVIAIKVIYSTCLVASQVLEKSAEFCITTNNCVCVIIGEVCKMYISVSKVPPKLSKLAKVIFSVSSLTGHSPRSIETFDCNRRKADNSTFKASSKFIGKLRLKFSQFVKCVAAYSTIGHSFRSPNLKLGRKLGEAYTALHAVKESINFTSSEIFVFPY